MSALPTTTYTPEEQFAAGVAAGISPEQMLANVDARISRVAENIADECRRAPNPEYATKYIREQAETAICLRALRAYVLSQILLGGANR